MLSTRYSESSQPAKKIINSCWSHFPIMYVWLCGYTSRSVAWIYINQLIIRWVTAWLNVNIAALHRVPMWVVETRCHWSFGAPICLQYKYDIKSVNCWNSVRRVSSQSKEVYFYSSVFENISSFWTDTVIKLSLTSSCTHDRPISPYKYRLSNCSHHRSKTTYTSSHIVKDDAWWFYWPYSQRWTSIILGKVWIFAFKQTVDIL